jgi:8-oxo-dGTP pyrophosphatase MutT (NUDIX family)
MMFIQKPSGFNSKFDVVSCFLEHEGRFLLLHRSDSENEGNRWGAPAGKVEKGEDLLDAATRELFEETGITLRKERLRYWGKTFVRYPKFDFVYHIYSTEHLGGPQIKINLKEHKNFRWVTPTEALAMPLMMDEDTSIKLFYKLMQ